MDDTTPQNIPDDDLAGLMHPLPGYESPAQQMARLQGESEADRALADMEKLERDEAVGMTRDWIKRTQAACKDPAFAERVMMMSAFKALTAMGFGFDFGSLRWAAIPKHEEKAN